MYVILNALPVSQLDDFNIVGKWGSCSDSLHYQGTLNVHNGQYLLSIYDHDSESLVKGPLRANHYAYGYRIMNGYKNNKEYHIPVAVTLFISLCIKANVAGNLAGLYNYHVYELSSLVISDKFCTSDLKFNQISIYLTNFSNFISHFRPRSKQISGKHDIDLKLPDGVNREIYHVNLSNKCKCMLSQMHYFRNIS